MRIIRHRIFHQGTFEHILRVVRETSQCHRAFGRFWEPVYRQGGVTIYQQTEYDLAWLQERIEDYEQFFYGSLASGFCSRDGLLRPRTRNVSHGLAGFRQSTF